VSAPRARGDSDPRRCFPEHLLTEAIFLVLSFINRYLIGDQFRYGKNQQFLEYVIKALVDKPEDVKIDRTVDEMGVLLKLTVNRDRHGQGHRSLRRYCQSHPHDTSRRRYENEARVNLKIEEPEGGFSRRRPVLTWKTLIRRCRNDRRCKCPRAHCARSPGEVTRRRPRLVEIIRI